MIRSAALQTATPRTAAPRTAAPRTANVPSAAPRPQPAAPKVAQAARPAGWDPALVARGYDANGNGRVDDELKLDVTGLADANGQVSVDALAGALGSGKAYVQNGTIRSGAAPAAPDIAVLHAVGALGDMARQALSWGDASSPGTAYQSEIQHSETRYRDEQRTREVTRYRNEQRTREVTKYHDVTTYETETVMRDETRTRTETYNGADGLQHSHEVSYTVQVPEQIQVPKTQSEPYQDTETYTEYNVPYQDTETYTEYNVPYTYNWSETLYDDAQASKDLRGRLQAIADQAATQQDATSKAIAQAARDGLAVNGSDADAYRRLYAAVQQVASLGAMPAEPADVVSAMQDAVGGAQGSIATLDGDLQTANASAARVQARIAQEQQAIQAIPGWKYWLFGAGDREKKQHQDVIDGLTRQRAAIQTVDDQALQTRLAALARRGYDLTTSQASTAASLEDARQLQAAGTALVADANSLSDQAKALDGQVQGLLKTLATPAK